MQAGANVDAQCDSGLTALHVTCRGQTVLVATLLLVINFMEEACRAAGDAQFCGRCSYRCIFALIMQ